MKKENVVAQKQLNKKKKCSVILHATEANNLFFFFFKEKKNRNGSLASNWTSQVVFDNQVFPMLGEVVCLF